MDDEYKKKYLKYKTKYLELKEIEGGSIKYHAQSLKRSVKGVVNTNRFIFYKQSEVDEYVTDQSQLIDTIDAVKAIGSSNIGKKFNVSLQHINSIYIKDSIKDGVIKLLKKFDGLDSNGINTHLSHAPLIQSIPNKNMIPSILDQKSSVQDIGVYVNKEFIKNKKIDRCIVIINKHLLGSVSSNNEQYKLLAYYKHYDNTTNLVFGENNNQNYIIPLKTFQNNISDLNNISDQKKND